MQRRWLEAPRGILQAGEGLPPFELERLPPSAGAAVRDFWRAWNRGHDAARAWQAFADALPALSAAAPAWSTHLQQAGELAAGLVQFSKDQLK